MSQSSGKSGKRRELRLKMPSRLMFGEKLIKITSFGRQLLIGPRSNLVRSNSVMSTMTING